MTRQPRASGTGEVVYLLDGNVLVALAISSHVHHTAAQHWFHGHRHPFASCPITQGTLLRLSMQTAAASVDTAVRLLEQLVAHPRHRFWPDVLGYATVSWRGVLGHRQITDAYLAALARHHHGRLVSFDRGLVALHADVAVGLDTAAAAGMR